MLRMSFAGHNVPCPLPRAEGEQVLEHASSVFHLYLRQLLVVSRTLPVLHQFLFLPLLAFL
jgi:hypothetical protein